MTSAPSAPVRIGFGRRGHAFVVEVHVAAAVGVVRSLFPADRAEAPEGPPDLILREGDGGFVLHRRGTGTWTADDLPGLLARLEMVLAEALLQASEGTGIHAAGLVSPAGAVLFSGAGGTGKSSLTAALAIRGWPVLGDDIVLLSGGLVHPFRRLIKVEEPARSLLGLPAGRAPLSIWRGADFYAPEALGSRWADPAPVAAVVFPRREDGSPPALTPLQPAASLTRLLAGLVLVERVEVAAFDAVVAAVGDARVFDLVYEDSAAAAELVAAEFA